MQHESIKQELKDRLKTLHFYVFVSAGGASLRPMVLKRPSSTTTTAASTTTTAMTPAMTTTTATTTATTATTVGAQNFRHFYQFCNQESQSRQHREFPSFSRVKFFKASEKEILLMLDVAKSNDEKVEND